MARQKWIYITIILALIIVFLAVIYLPMYIQADSEECPENMGNQSELNESQLALLNEIWGADITMGEYYELIYPEFLAEMPPELKEEIYNKTMEWPKEGKKSWISGSVKSS